MNRLRTTLFATVFVFQIFFGLFYESISGGAKDIYPFFNWHIFHTDPYKFRFRNLLIVQSINGEPLAHPTDILDLKNRFRGIDFYSFSKKVNMLGNALRESRPDEALELTQDIHQVLLRDVERVKYEIVFQKMDVVQFAKDRSYVWRESVRTDEIHR